MEEEISGNGISTIGKWKFTILQNEMVHLHVKIAFFTWVFGLLVKVVANSAVDPGYIPGSAQLRQKSDVRQEIANSAIRLFFQNLKF